ncbi:MAG: hypothetical protein ACO24U_00815 [Prochlorococcaceae cyanobacterium]
MARLQLPSLAGAQQLQIDKGSLCMGIGAEAHIKEVGTAVFGPL